MNLTMVAFHPADLFLAVVTGFVGFLGVPGNFFVIYLTLKTENLRQKPHCWLLLNLAISDLVFCLVNCGLQSHQVLNLYRVDIVCEFAGFLEYTSGFTSFLIIPAIAVNRYVVFNVKPNVFLSRFFRKRV